MVTTVLVLPTQRYKNDGYSSNNLASAASYIQDNWNDYIETSSGTYRMNATSDYSSTVDIGSPSSVDEALTASQEEVASSYPSVLSNYDAILVEDSRNYAGNTAGKASGVGGPTVADDDYYKLCAGSTLKDRCVAYCSYTLSNHLETHEVGHLYGGRHRRHEIWGVFEHTVMGNSGNPTCSGGDSTDRTRRGDFNGCSVDDIRYYMDYWGIY
ncbi:hypothetical protein [Haladaptatus sp. DYSN1]|uniref:hypothetical protein n=1 Tax=unclassified Haladaptatus TaxID=2622732 RepID=UPI002406C3A9|nr:hypothetical protein [Haladaptatus sp. DYSN1]